MVVIVIYITKILRNRKGSDMYNYDLFHILCHLTNLWIMERNEYACMPACMYV
jgi:hypothetical protein